MAHLGKSRLETGLHQPRADINITPLVDVMLVLLIIFMVTAPMLAAGIKINLPNANTAQRVDLKEPLIVSITRTGELDFDGQPIARNALISALKAQLGTDPARAVQLRGDRDLPYGEIVSLMDELAANGIARIIIRTDNQPKTPSPPPAAPQ